MLCVNGVSVKYGDNEALKPTNFEAKSGEILGLIGAGSSDRGDSLKNLPKGAIYPKRGKRKKRQDTKGVCNTSKADLQKPVSKNRSSGGRFRIHRG